MIYKYLLSAVSLLFLFSYNQTEAITSYDVTNEVQMYLDTTISATTATGIVLASPQRNGANHTFATLTGGVLRLRSGSKVEDIHYSLAEVRSNNTVNLQGVTRNLCTGITKAYVTCGNGKQFSRGALVELSVDARLLNLKANIDRDNVYTAEQSYSESGAFKMPTFTTEAERDRQTDEGDGNLACVTGTSQCYDYIGGAWRAHSGSNVTNATQTVAGKVEIATLAEMSTHSSTGSTAANLVVWNANLISSSAIYYPASVTYGSGATSTFGTWGSVTDGEFTVLLDGVSTDVVGINFIGVASMTNVAERIEGELNTDATGTGYTVTWVGNGTSTGFTLTSSNLTGASSGSALSAVSAGAGTDISGASYMDGNDDSLNVQTFRVPSKNHVADAWKVPILNSKGVLGVSLGGTGTGSLTMSGIVIGQGTGALITLAPTNEGDVVQVDANGSWVSGVLSTEYNVQEIEITDGTERGISTTAEGVMATTTFAANSLSQGNRIRIKSYGIVEVESNNDPATLRLKLGGVTIFSTTLTASIGGSPDTQFVIDADLVVRTDGAGGTVHGGWIFTFRGAGFTESSPYQIFTLNSVMVGDTIALDTTASNDLELTVQFAGSHADNGALTHQWNVDLLSSN